MKAPLTPHATLETRLARSVGRSGRDRMANARVTQAEQRELHNAARSQGKSLSEWAREVRSDARLARGAAHMAETATASGEPRRSSWR